MTATLDATGLHVQTFDEILDEVVAALTTALSLTPPQAYRVRQSVQSVLGNLARIHTENEQASQEVLLAVYNALSWDAEGTQLERVVALLGVTRRAAFASRVTGPAAGTVATVIPNGTRLQYLPEGTTWAVVDGPYTIGGGGTVEIALESELEVANVVAVDPETGFDDWLVLDAVVGFSDVGGFESAAQPIIGSPVETDAALRARASVEAYQRGQGPLAAIEAAVSAVDGVTFVRAWDNTGDPASTDANGIPGRAINVVVEGGDDDEIIAAILAKRPAGALLFGTDVTETADLEHGRYLEVGFDRVTALPMHIRATVTTSTSEETAPADLADVVEARLLERAPELFGIGDDVLPLRLAATLADIPGIDAAIIELSLDGAAWGTAKRVVTIRQRSTYDAARITVIED